MHRFSEQKFTVRDILHHEAEALSNHSPSRGDPVEPECDLDPFTRLRDLGAGACRVKQWPDDEAPYAWGCRNESLLLDESIHFPARWEVDEEYRGRFNHLLGPIDYTYMDGGLNDSDGGYEGRLLVVLENILRRVSSIAFVFLIQLWRRNPEHISHPEYNAAFAALHHLSLKQIRTSERMSSQNRGVAVMVPCIQSAKKYEEYNTLLIGTVQRTGFAEKLHEDEHGYRTTDGVLSSILDNDADQDTNDLFLKSGLRNDWQSAAVGHIIHMSYVSSLCTSRMGLATSIWGYLRFFVQIDSTDGYAPILYITRNVGTDTAWSDSYRKDNSSNFKLLCHIYYFVLLALMKTHGPRIFPPDLRGNKDLLNFFSSMNERFNKPFNLFSCSSRCFQPLPRLIKQISKCVRSIRFSLCAALWESILYYCGSSVLEWVGYLRIELLESKLKRISGDGHIKGTKTLYLRFDSWDIRDVTEVGVSQKAGLVLKVFHTHEMFESELRAYLALQEAGVRFIPRLLGVFNIPGTKGSVLLTMAGKPTEAFAPYDRHHLIKTIRKIHAANIHHHDLRLDNILRGADGRLRIIDFGHSSTSHECRTACPDQSFLKLLDGSMNISDP